MKRVIPEKEDRKKLFKRVFKLNPHLTIRALSMLSGESQKNIEHVLYGDKRYPSMWLLFVSIEAARRSCGTIDREMLRTTGLYFSRLRDWALKNKQGDQPMNYGGIIQKKRKPRKFIFRGEAKTIYAIAAELGVGYNAVYHKLKNMAEGENVDQVIAAAMAKKTKGWI